MKVAGWKIFAGKIVRKLVFFSFISFCTFNGHTQCGALTSPGLFGLSQTSIYCKNQNIQIGVYNSVNTQSYTFSVYRNGVLAKKKGGPLTGNGQTLSVAATMRSAQDAGEYRIVSYDACGNADSTSYFTYYGAIDNLSIVSWGNNNVKFNWAACSPEPVTANSYIVYDYIVTTRANPNLVSTDSILTTTDTFALVSNSSLANGKTYYIHVRVEHDGIVRNGNFVTDAFNCTGYDANFNPLPLPWQTIKFTACSGAAPTTGTITPVNAIVCTGNTVTLTGSAALTHKWYKDTTVISGATAATYNAPDSGQFRHYVTLSGLTCQGMVATSTVLKSSTETGHFFGGGNFFAGDTVRLGIDSTVTGQTYKILKDGVEVYSMPGIGFPEQSYSPDTIWYKFAITSANQAGLYTVRVISPYCSSIDFGNAQVNLITSVTICPNSSTFFTFSSAGNNTIFQWQVDAGSGFNNISNAGVYSGATTKTLNITNAPSTMYGYNYRCVASGGAAVTSSTRTLKFGVAWLGTTSTAWLTPSNWTCGVAPNANTDVIVQAALIPSTNQPVISSNVSCKSVVIKSGCTTCTLKVNTGSVLTITGP